MRLKVSGSKLEIRQSYIPALFPHLVVPLMDQGVVRSDSLFIWLPWLTTGAQSAVDDVIGRMDEYYLSKDDWDAVVELGVGDQKDEVVMKKITPATKSALTRKWVFLLFVLVWKASVFSIGITFVGITTQSILYRFIKHKIWGKCQKSWQLDQDLILRMHLMYVSSLERRLMVTLCFTARRCCRRCFGRREKEGYGWH